jgi:DNA polymerase III subunit delta'
MFALDLPEQHDTLPGVPAPVLTRHIFGHDQQLSFLADSYRSGRLHHAFLFEGQNGIGKATAAFHLAQHLIGSPIASDAPNSLQLLAQVSNDYRQLASGTHPQALHLTRPFDPKTERYKTLLTVDEIRRVGHFLSRTNAGAGYRVIIVDPADDMNAAAANALLKSLEEPPSRAIFILISHGAGRLLPTIRSRCQVLQFDALEPEDLKAAIEVATSGADIAGEYLLALAQGSVRRALTLSTFGGLEILRAVDHLLEAPTFEADKAAKLGDAITGREADIQYQLLTDHLLSKISAAALRHLASNGARRAHWLSQQHCETANMLRTAQTYNLDRKQTVFGLIALLHRNFGAGLL